MEKNIDQILKKIKNYIVNFPEIAINIVNALGSALTQADSFK
jgi:hypothetical protein